jgi:hypothetical protein
MTNNITKLLTNMKQIFKPNNKLKYLAIMVLVLSLLLALTTCAISYIPFLNSLLNYINTSLLGAFTIGLFLSCRFICLIDETYEDNLENKALNWLSKKENYNTVYHLSLILQLKKEINEKEIEQILLNLKEKKVESMNIHKIFNTFYRLENTKNHQQLIHNFIINNHDLINMKTNQLEKMLKNKIKEKLNKIEQKNSLTYELKKEMLMESESTFNKNQSKSLSLKI